MASIDRHQYSEEIRKGAAKFVKDLNLDTKSPAYIPRKGVNGDSGMLKKVSNNLSSKLEYFQKLDKESVSSSFSLPRRSSAGSPATTNLIKNTSHINGEKSQEMPHLNGSLLTKTNGHGPELNGDQRLKNRSSIGAIASFALGDTASHSVDTKLQAGLEAQISFSKAVSGFPSKHRAPGGMDCARPESLRTTRATMLPCPGCEQSTKSRTSPSTNA